VGTRGLVSQLARLDGDAGQRTGFWGLTDTHPFFYLNTRTRQHQHTGPPIPIPGGTPRSMYRMQTTSGMYWSKCNTRQTDEYSRGAEDSHHITQTPPGFTRCGPVRRCKPAPLSSPCAGPAPQEINQPPQTQNFGPSMGLKEQN
jgi:hypothetical protein